MSPFAKLSLLIIAAIALIDAIWIAYAGFDFMWGDVLRTCISVAILAAVSYFYTVHRPVKEFANVSLWTAILILFSAVAATSSYLFTSLGLPLNDGTLAAMDEAIGFDWKAALSFFADHRMMAIIFSISYTLTLLLVAVTLLFLGFSKRHRELECFMTALIISCIVAIVVSGLYPAIGAYAYYAPGAELFKQYTPAVFFHGGEKPMHYEHFVGLRDGSYRILSLAKTEGLITFPSFHTVMSVLMILALRSSGKIFWLGAFLNTLVLISVPIDGGHYLVDVIGGAVLAVLVWVGVRKLHDYLSGDRVFQWSVRSQVVAVHR